MGSSRLTSGLLTLIGLALCAAPFQYIPWIPGAGVYDNQRLLTTVCALFAAVVVIYRVCTEPVLYIDLNKRQRVLVALFFLMGLAAAGRSYSVEHALFELSTFVLLFLLAWLISDHVKNNGEAALDATLLWCGLACAIYLVVHFAVYSYVLRAGVQPKLSQLFFGYNNHRFFNHVQTISLPLLGLFALRLEDSFRRYFWTVVTILWWALLYASAGRGSMLGLFLGLLLTGLLFRSAARIWLKFMLLSAVAGLGAFGVIYAGIPWLRQLHAFGAFFNIAQRSIDNPTSSRIALWERAADLMVENPLFGVGPGHFSHHSHDLNVGAHPHNWLLQIGSEWGLVALNALLGAVFFGLASMAKIKRTNSSKDQLTQSALLTTGFAIVIDGMVSGLIVFPVSQLWIAVFVGIAWGWHALHRQPEGLFEVKKKFGAGATMIAIIGLLSAFVIHFIISQLDAVSIQPDMIKSGTFLYPRFFMNGFF